MFLLLISFALAQEPAAKEQKAKLTQILATLERLHPELAHEESERACHATLQRPADRPTSAFVECVKVAEAHGIPRHNTDEIVADARRRFPDLMARQPEAFWQQRFDAARVAYGAQLVVTGPHPLPQPTP